jgi:hypothetical protein
LGYILGDFFTNSSGHPAVHPQVVLAIGFVSSFFFHLLVPHADRPANVPPPPTAAPPGEEVEGQDPSGPEPSGHRVKMTIVEWLRQPQLYQVPILRISISAVKVCRQIIFIDLRRNLHPNPKNVDNINRFKSTKKPRNNI